MCIHCVSEFMMAAAESDLDQVEIVLPGQLLSIPLKLPFEKEPLILGPGLQRDGEEVVVTRPGVLRYKSSPRAYWVDTHSKRYIPVDGDRVLGIVTQRLTEGWKVDLGSSEQASLPYLSFEGATKRNRPNVNVGDLVYCKIVLAIKDMEPELTCMEGGKSRGLGVISSEGFLLQISLNLTRRLLNVNFPLLDCLGRHCKFEITCGMNGRVHIRASSTKEIAALTNAIWMAEYASDDQVNNIVDEVFTALRG